MQRKAFSLRGSGAQRPATTGRALIPPQPRNTAHRRIFSSNEQRNNRANAEALEEAANRMDEPPAYLHDDSRMHRPYSNPRFGPLKLPSREGFDIQVSERPHNEPSQEGSHAEESEVCILEDESESDGKGVNSHGQNSSQGEPSYSQAQELIDSLWQFNQVPEKLQEWFDGMKEEIDTRRTKLSTEKRTSARLSRDVATLGRELNSLRAKEKEREDVLGAEKTKSDGLREELETLRSESRRDRQIFEKSQANMNKKLEKLSQELKEAKNNTQLKDKELTRIQREVVCLKQENESEVGLREGAVAESQVFKRNIFELRRRSNKEKGQLLASQEEKEEKLAKLGEQNQALTARVAALEEATEHQRELKEAVEGDLHDVLSFLRRSCNIVQQAYLAACAHGRRGLHEVIAFPSSVCLNIGEECRDYEVFRQLFTVLNESLSSESVLELASTYEEALSRFFKTLVLREVAHSQYVCSTDDDFKKVKAIHKQLRHHIQGERQRLRDRSMDLSSDILLQREQASMFNAALARKGKEIEEDMMKRGEVFRRFKSTSTAVMTVVTSCKRHLNFVKDELVKSKTWQSEVCEDFKTLLSKNVRGIGSLCGELEKARAAIKNLDHAASASAKKQKEVEAALRGEIAGLTTLVTQREAVLKQITISEANLRKTKEELESTFRQAITECEENKKRTAALNRQNEKLTKEKDDTFMKLAEAESANQRMSEKVTEALSAKQSALEALVIEKNANEDRRTRRTRVSGTSSEQRIQHEALQALIQDDYLRDTHDREKGLHANIRMRESALNASSHKSHGEKLHPSSAMMHDSPLIQTGENVEADLCEVDLAPKRPKRRTAVQKTRQNPRQKRARANTAKRATAAGDTPRHDPKPRASPKKAIPDQNVKCQTSSTSSQARDEDWDIDFYFGELGE